MSITLAKAKSVHPLASIVLSQLGGGKDAIESAIDAANHGADGGFHGFICYSEIEPWVRRNKAAIKAALTDAASDMGVGVVDMVRGFGCLSRKSNEHRIIPTSSTVTEEEVASVIYGDGSDAGDMAGMIYSALAWFALEEVGRAIIDNNER